MLSWRFKVILLAHCPSKWVRNINVVHMQSFGHTVVTRINMSDSRNIRAINLLQDMCARGQALIMCECVLLRGTCRVRRIRIG